MFCASLRRRASIAPGIAVFAPMGIREHQLTTHDIEIPLGSSVDQASGNITSTRRLRILLLSASATSDAKLPQSLDRVSHFGSLTGGQDIAIVFMLCPPQATTFITAKQVNEIEKTGNNVEGVSAYSKLQARLIEREDIPHIPMLLLSKLDELPNLLKRHIARLARQPPLHRPTNTTMELLKLCTSNPPISQQTAFILSDIFTDLRDLAETCRLATSAPPMSPPGNILNSSQLSNVECWETAVNSHIPASTGISKLKHLHGLVDSQEFQEIVEFWKNERVIG